MLNYIVTCNGSPIAAFDVRQVAEQYARNLAAANPQHAYAVRQRNVGGSLLPSSESRILQPVDTPFGTLQVRAIAELDTHGLFHRHADGESLLATHPNGYSCHVLLERMQAGGVDGAVRQAKYILACGGTTRHPDHIAATMQITK